MSDSTILGMLDPKRNAGFSLVVISFLLLYASPFFARGSALVQWAGLAVAALLAIAGVLLMFKQFKHEASIQQPLAENVGSSNLEHVVDQLGKNYDVLRQQTTQGFIIAAFVMILGVLVVLAGVVGQEFGLSKTGHLTTLAGIVMDAVSAIGLYLFNQTFSRLNLTSDRLHDTWRVLEAFRRAEQIAADKRDDVVKRLIEKLVEPTSPSSLTSSKRKSRKSSAAAE